jgi:UDP-3-O-[3-hydroxymyristoyl] glucosamine N-acyltransferase
MNLKDIAAAVRGDLIGDPGAEVTSAAPIDRAGEGVLTFAASKHYLKDVENSRATCIIVPKGFSVPNKNLIVVDDPRLALAKALEAIYRSKEMSPGIAGDAYVAEDVTIAPSSHVGRHAYICEGAKIGERTLVSPYVYVGSGTVIGSDCAIHPHVTLYEGVVLGDRVVVHANAVLGSDGFGYAADGEAHRKIPQVGTVVIEDDVEIGANAAVDRATLGETRIKRGTKIDNLVHIAHNVIIDENCLIVAQVGIAGSTEVGDNVIIGGQAGLVHHIKIGRRSTIGAQAGVTRSFPEGSTISGYPARDHSRSMKGYAALSRLPSLLKEMRQMGRRLDELERRIGKTRENSCG